MNRLLQDYKEISETSSTIDKIDSILALADVF